MASSSSSRGASAFSLPFGKKRPRRPHILLAASGSMDAVSFENLCITFTQWADVLAVATKTAMRFIGQKQLANDVYLYTDDDEWFFWKKIGDSVLHIELQKWADIMVIAPLSANTLAKIAGGLCDNLLTSIVRAWDYNMKQIFVAPAMDPLMWKNSLTEHHLSTLDDNGINLIPPVSSGNSGTGSMAEVSHIYETIKFCWDSKRNQPGHS